MNRFTSKVMVLLVGIALAYVTCDPLCNETLANPLISEDFSGNSLAGFEVISGSWSVANGQLYVANPGENVLTGTADIILSQLGNFNNGSVSVDMTHLSGYTSTSIIVRYQDLGHFYMGVIDSYAENIHAVPARSLAIYKISDSAFEADALGTWYAHVPGMPWQYLHLLAGMFFPIDLGSPYSLSMKVSGSSVALSVDGDELLRVTDHNDAYLYGRAGLLSYQTTAAFDNFSVTCDHGAHVPEPSTNVLLGISLAGLIFVARRRGIRTH